jgi:serine/threonine protein kinase/formylglycine-generating enzyme required for sulfatase activity/dienelactone hydrolase
MTLSAGTRLGPYEILSPLGAGGMGEVYRARDPRLGREVAIKVLPARLASDPEALARFEREARAVAALSHSNILAIHDFGSHDDIAYAVTELLEGQTLRGRLDAGPLSLNEVVDLALQVVHGLSAAHGKGIIHRDLKPENIFVTTDGPVKILDFGLVKRITAIPEGEETSAPTVTGQTTPGVVMGTLSYMSPEQVKGLSVDPRSDLFSFGAVLYEMATRERPFRGNSAVAVTDAILHAEPRDIARVPGELNPIVRKLLEKDPTRRYGTAAEVDSALRAVETSLSPSRRALRPRTRIALVAGAIAVAAVGAWIWQRVSRQRRALESIPEISRLLAAADYSRAAALAREARLVLRGDPTLEKLWTNATGDVSIDTVPSDADVSIRPFAGDPNAWESIGRTPVRTFRLAKIPFVWKISKPGFSPLVFIDVPSVNEKPKLSPKESVPTGMVAVMGAETGVYFPGLNLPEVPLENYAIDRHEVTNEEYKKFVDAGGYQKRDFWKQPFVRDGRTVPWDDAIALFRDTTGRAGPATWEVGGYPKGLEKHPVAGVSWYEAAAYAEFAGKSLPTLYHWAWAAEIGLASLIVPGSNFSGTGTVAVEGRGSLSGFGTFDMAGNVKEWCWNENGNGKRYILGGGFGEPSYMFVEADAQSPWDRRPNFGFRCVKLLSPAPSATTAAMAVTSRDFSKERPVSDEVFRAFARLYTYDKTALNASVEETAQDVDWVREKLVFDAAYGGERLIAYLYLPKNVAPPFQTVVFFPGSDAIFEEKFQEYSGAWDFLVKSGRALMFPVYKSTFERRDGLKSDDPQETAFYRDHMIEWSKDLGRSVDYLETRNDIDHARIAYYGFSWGATVGPVLLAVDGRFHAAILGAGGLDFLKSLPEADPINFAGHLKMPVLMANGRFDNFFPVDASQRPLFRLLGTTEADKKHVIYETGHAIFGKEFVRDSLDWLDKYLGPVKR